MTNFFMQVIEALGWFLKSNVICSTYTIVFALPMVFLLHLILRHTFLYFPAIDRCIYNNIHKITTRIHPNIFIAIITFFIAWKVYPLFGFPFFIINVNGAYVIAILLTKSCNIRRTFRLKLIKELKFQLRKRKYRGEQ